MESDTDLEIERKFLIDPKDIPPNIDQFTSYKIEQGYIPNQFKRIRKKTGEDGESQFFQTEKRGSGIARYEHEFELSEDEFNEKWPLTTGQRIEKTRTEIPLDVHTIELDIFLLYFADRTALVMAEVEFDSVANAEAFFPPNWFGPEVTEHPDYQNYALATHGSPLKRPLIK